MVINKYNGKPVIASPVPFWRNHIFPWGWYELKNLPLNVGDVISSDGCYSPGDGGDNTYEVVSHGGSEDGGALINYEGKNLAAQLDNTKGKQWG